MCPHNITNIDPDTGEVWCVRCGDVVDYVPESEIRAELEAEKIDKVEEL